MNKIDSLFKKNIKINIPKFNLQKPVNATIPQQRQWQQMSMTQRAVQRIMRRDTDRDGVPNGFDCRVLDPRKQHLLRKINQMDLGHGRKVINYATPQGHTVTFEYNKKIGFSHYPTMDDVGYVLDNLPVKAMPENTRIRFTPRQYALDKQRASDKHAGQYFYDSDNEEHNILIFPRNPPETRLAQTYTWAYKKKYPSMSIQRARELGKQLAEDQKDNKLDEEYRNKYEDAYRNFKTVFTHELGHAIVKEKNIKKEYEEKKLDPKQAPTVYGKESMGEDLAESFVTWNKVPNYHPRNAIFANAPSAQENLKKRTDIFETKAPETHYLTNKNVRELTEEIVHPDNYDLVKNQKYDETVNMYSHMELLNDAEQKQRYNAQEASLEKQKEWREKIKLEKEIEQITKPDTDGDKVPDEFDCKPKDPNQQDRRYKRFNVKYTSTRDKSLPGGWDRYTKQHDEKVKEKMPTHFSEPPWALLKMYKQEREEREILEQEIKQEQDARLMRELKNSKSTICEGCGWAKEYCECEKIKQGTGTKHISMRKDTDGDGLVDGIDCDPLDPEKQGSRHVKKAIINSGMFIGYNSDKDILKAFRKEGGIREDFKRKSIDKHTSDAWGKHPFEIYNMSDDERKNYVREKEEESRELSRQEDEYIRSQEKHWSDIYDEMEQFEEWRDENRTFSFEPQVSNIDDDYEEYQEMKKRQEPKVVKKWNYKEEEDE